MKPEKSVVVGVPVGSKDKHQHGKTPVADFSIKRETYYAQDAAVTMHWIATSFIDHRDGVMASEEVASFDSHSNRRKVVAELLLLKQVIAQDQEGRLNAYLERCRKKCSTNDEFLSLLVRPAQNKKLDAVTVKLDGESVTISKEEMKEYSDLAETISDRLRKQRQHSKPVRSQANLTLLLGIGLPVLTYWIGCVATGASSSSSAAVLHTFATNPAAYITLSVIAAVCIVAAICLHVKANKHLAQGKSKHPLPTTATFWRTERMKQQSKEANQADPAVVRVEV